MEEKFLTSWEELKLDKKFKDEIDSVRDVIHQTAMDFHNYVFPKYINNYKKYIWFVSDRLSKIDWWQSNINYPMVSSAIDTMFSNIFDFWYDIWVSEEWLKAACIKSFDFRNIGKNVLKEVTKEALIVGKWYAKDYFIKEEFRDKFFDREISYDIKMPSMQYVSVFDVMYDRSKWIEKSSYKIIRTFASWDAIKKKILPLILSQYSKAEHKAVITKIDKNLKDYKLEFGSRFSMYDYNPVKELTSVTLWTNSDTNADYYNLKMCSKKWELTAWCGVDTSMKEDSKNYFLNDNKATYEIVEYYTSEDKYIFINWHLMYFGKSKHNLSKIREVKFSEIPWTWNATWMADKLAWHQDLQNTLWNSFIDNIKLILWPMFKVTGNLPMAKSWKIDFAAFRAYKTNGSADLEKIQLWDPSYWPLQFMEMNQAAAIQESWMNNYIAWWSWSIERVQWGLDLKWWQYKAKLTPLTDSVDQLMWNICRSWILMYLKFYTKEELAKMNINIIERYIKDEKWKDIFETLEVNWIDIKQIIDETNISFSYNTLYKVTQENARDLLTKNFQFMVQYMPNAINIEEMWKVFAWYDFDPLKVLQKPNTTVEQTEQVMTEENIQEPVEEQPEQWWQDQLMQQLQWLI